MDFPVSVILFNYLGANQSMENKKINIKSGIHKHEAGIKTYIFIWIILLMFTAITVMVAKF